MIHLTELKKQFRELIELPKHERMLELCGLLSEYLERYNIQPLIVGGLSVEIYTRQNYTTYDIDLISDGRERIDTLLTDELGFIKEGRSWYHPELEISIEIPDNHLEGSLDKVMKLELESGREIYVIGIEDIIIHRLESAFVSQPANPEWTDDYEWAERMFQVHKTDRKIMDIDYLTNAGKKVQVDHIIKDWLKN